MDFSWSERQRALFDSIGRMAAELNGDLLVRDREGVFDRAGWQRCGALGIQGLPVPADYGGLGADALTTVGALERLGYVCRDNGLIFSINAHLWTVCMPLVAFGTEAQKRQYLPKLSRGELIGGNAMTEADAGSDAYSLTTTARREGDHYVLNGTKTFVSNAPIADLIMTFATIDRSKGASGICGFLVEKEAPGFTISRPVEKMGLHTSPTGQVTFENCRVPVDSRLGAEGAGPALFTHSMTWERGCILASAVGSMQRLLERCIRQARQRKQFGRAIGGFQMVSSKIVDMKLRLETARQMLYHSAWLRSQGRTAVLEAAMAKLHISEAWVQSCLDAIQIHGSGGYLTEGEVERELRDAVGSRLYSGTSEIQRTIIAAMLGLPSQS
jgi:alkylation response protein AidB-like acyl-CoA dehydrogenase